MKRSQQLLLGLLLVMAAIVTYSGYEQLAGWKTLNRAVLKHQIEIQAWLQVKDAYTYVVFEAGYLQGQYMVFTGNLDADSATIAARIKIALVQFAADTLPAVSPKPYPTPREKRFIYQSLPNVPAVSGDTAEDNPPVRPDTTYWNGVRIITWPVYQEIDGKIIYWPRGKP